MSFIKKSDVKNHLSRRNPARAYLYQPVSQPDAARFSGAEPGHMDSLAEHAVQESTAGPIPSVPRTPSAAMESGLKPVLVPAISKSARA